MGLFRFNKSLYATGSLQETVNIFEDFAEITIDWDNPEYFMVEISALQQDNQKQIEGEFMNYFLATTVINRNSNPKKREEYRYGNKI